MKPINEIVDELKTTGRHTFPISLFEQLDKYIKEHSLQGNYTGNGKCLKMYGEVVEHLQQIYWRERS